MLDQPLSYDLVTADLPIAIVFAICSVSVPFSSVVSTLLHGDVN